jgi:hypothetical protein
MKTFEHTLEDELWELLETIKYLQERAELQREELNQLIKEMS